MYLSEIKFNYVEQDLLQSVGLTGLLLSSVNTAVVLSTIAKVQVIVAIQATSSHRVEDNAVREAGINTDKGLRRHRPGNIVRLVATHLS